MTLGPGPADAQLAVTIGGAAALVEHRVEAGYGAEIASGGVFVGSAGVKLWNRVGLTAVAQAGVLEPRAGAGLKRELAEVGVLGACRLLRWLSIEGGVRWRAYSTVLARERWAMLEVGAAARVPFAVRGLYGLGSVAVEPRITVTGSANPRPGFSALTGVEYTPGRLGVQLVYLRERYEFPAAGGIRRLEQVSSAAIRLTLGVLGRGEVP